MPGDDSTFYGEKYLQSLMREINLNTDKIKEQKKKMATSLEDEFLVSHGK